MKKLIWALVFIANIIYANVNIIEKKHWVIRGKGYMAKLGADGCLHSLKIKKSEFFAAGTSISRGSYFYQKGVLRLPQITREGNTIKAESEKASIEYVFSKKQMSWNLFNKTEASMNFFIVFKPHIKNVFDKEGKAHKAPINKKWQETTWIYNNARLTLKGSTRLWGPWAGDTQVWEVHLKAKEKHTIELLIGKATTEEMKKSHSSSPVLLPPIVIAAPRNYQVFQRQTIEQGEIFVSGKINTNATHAKVKIIGNSLKGVLPGVWQEAELNKITNSFYLKTKLAAGGWYQLEVKAFNKDKEVAKATVSKFGVGEVFVGAGQSNSTNSGQFKIQQTTNMVSSFSGTRWQLANDPQPGVHDRSQGGSFWPAFGDALYNKYKVPIGIATTGHGGTSVVRWHPDTPLFSWMMRRIHQLGPGGFRALLWHQGESDVSMETQEYYQRLKEVIETSKTIAGWDFPWFVAWVSYHNPKKNLFASTRNAQKRLWDEKIALAGPDTDTLTGDHRDHKGKGIHFSPKGLKAHGKMWAKITADYIDRTYGIYKSPETSTIEEIQEFVLSSQKALFIHADIDKYMSLWTKDAKIIAGRGEKPGKYDIKLNYKQIYTTRLIRFWKMPPVAKNMSFAHIKGEIKENQTTLQVKTKILFSPETFEEVNEIYRLRWTAQGWKVYENRWWLIQTKYAENPILHNSEYWQVCDKKVKDQSKLEMPYQQLFQAFRYKEAHKAILKILTKDKKLTIQKENDLWVMRGLAAIFYGEYQDALLSYKHLIKKKNVYKYHFPPQFARSLERLKLVEKKIAEFEEKN